MAELYKSVTELMKTARENKALQGNLGDITDFQQIVDDTPTADVVEVVRCKDCVWFVPEHIKLSDGTTRPYTDEEKKLPCGVTSDIGINVGSYCLRKVYWEQNGIPVWFEENDFCSYGEKQSTISQVNMAEIERSDT